MVEVLGEGVLYLQLPCMHAQVVVVVVVFLQTHQKSWHGLM